MVYFRTFNAKLTDETARYLLERRDCKGVFCERAELVESWREKPELLSVYYSPYLQDNLLFTNVAHFNII